MFDSYAVLSAARDLLAASLGVQQSEIGEPDTTEYRVSAYSMLGAQAIEDEASGGALLRSSEVFVGLSYVVKGAKATAEQTICQTVDDFIRRFYLDRTLGDACENGRLDMSLNSRPIYGQIGGEECRIYVIRVLFDQRETIRSI